MIRCVIRKPALRRFSSICSSVFYFTSGLTFVWGGSVVQAANPAMGRKVVYELQVRSANACHPWNGSSEQRAACLAKPGVTLENGAGGPARCEQLFVGEELASHDATKMGTLEDLLQPTADYRQGITLQYIRDRVGANAVWLMPLFPNNDRWALPSLGDTLGSPYAVRDYLHVSGLVSRECIEERRDEFSYEDRGGKPCWGDASFDRVVKEARELGIELWLDVAFNHFGHNYFYYDYASFLPVEERVRRGESLSDLWDFERTYEEMLLWPEILDTPEKLDKYAAVDPTVAQALQEVRDRFSLAGVAEPRGDERVRLVNMWRSSLAWERDLFRPDGARYLEFVLPGFYLGAKDSGGPRPSSRAGDNFTNNWRDVKFLYHHDRHPLVHARNREYLFRVLNYWVSRGVRGFRLDHTTDGDSGISADDWRYIVSKVNYYDWRRQGRPVHYEPPVYLAEEFHDQLAMNGVVDAMTEGYVGDIRGHWEQGEKNASFVERQLSKDARFRRGDSDLGVYVMRGLETHDEKRLTEGTGFDPWTGAVFWAIGAASRGLPMILTGQEFGESWGLGFRGPARIHSRFVGDGNYRDWGDSLVNFYGRVSRARLDWRNASALASDDRWFLRKNWDGGINEQIFAQARYVRGRPEGAVFTYFKLWEVGAIAEHYSIPAELASRMGVDPSAQYRWVDALDPSEQARPLSDCRSGRDWVRGGVEVSFRPHERLLWLRLVRCGDL